MGMAFDWQIWLVFPPAEHMFEIQTIPRFRRKTRVGNSRHNPSGRLSCQGHFRSVFTPRFCRYTYQSVPGRSGWPSRDPIGEFSFVSQYISKNPPENYSLIEQGALLPSYGFCGNNSIMSIDIDGSYAIAIGGRLLIAAFEAALMSAAVAEIGALANEADKPTKRTGDCRQSQHALLQASVGAAKATTSALGKCKPGDCCFILKTKKAAWLSLAEARDAINKTCYRGGDPGHQTASAQAWQNVGTCQNLMNSQCK